MREAAPWFKCFPTKLLHALAGMEPDEGYVYVVILMRIYEDGGPIRDDARTLARRTGYTERRVANALAGLIRSGRISAENNLIDSDTTHETLRERERTSESASSAGKTSAAKRAEKRQQNQASNSTTAAFPSERNSTIIEVEAEVDRDTSSLRSDVDAPKPERPKSQKRARIRGMLAEDQQPTDRQTEMGYECGMSNTELAAQWRKFIDYHRAKGNLIADATAAWRTWCGNFQSFRQPVRLVVNSDPDPPPKPSAERHLEIARLLAAQEQAHERG